LIAKKGEDRRIKNFKENLEEIALKKEESRIGASIYKFGLSVCLSVCL